MSHTICRFAELFLSESDSMKINLQQLNSHKINKIKIKHAMSLDVGRNKTKTIYPCSLNKGDPKAIRSVKTTLRYGKRIQSFKSNYNPRYNAIRFYREISEKHHH